MSESVGKQKSNFLTGDHNWATPVLLVILVAIFVVSLVLGSQKPAKEGEGFAGTDDAAAQAAEAAGAKQWIKPIFEPNSGEVESGLFALQAALGAGIVGFALGRMSGRKKGHDEAMAASQLPDELPASARPSDDKAAETAADPAPRA